jgi:hypothetical protein
MHPKSQKERRHTVDVIGVMVSDDERAQFVEVNPGCSQPGQGAARAINQKGILLPFEHHVSILVIHIGDRSRRAKDG